jgi:malate dehydrogenase
MPTVAIIGAGELGGTIAHTLAVRAQITEIRLIDDLASLAAGKALDIRQSGPLERSDTQFVASGDLAMAVGADVVVIADAAGPHLAEWAGETGLVRLRHLAEQDRDTVIVCAGASQRKLMQQAIRDGIIEGARLIGSAPIALASAVRAIVALEADCAARDVTLSILGVPPETTVVTWDSATVFSAPLTKVLSDQSIARVKARMAHLWPPGPYGLASAASNACEAIANGRSRPVFSCFVGTNDLPAQTVIASPVRLGPNGVREHVAPRLGPSERVEFESALARAEGQLG